MENDAGTSRIPTLGLGGNTTRKFPFNLHCSVETDLTKRCDSSFWERFSVPDSSHRISWGWVWVVAQVALPWRASKGTVQALMVSPVGSSQGNHKASKYR